MRKNLLITAILLSTGISLTACQGKNKAAEKSDQVAVTEVGKETEGIKEYGEVETVPADSIPNFFEQNREKANSGPDKVFNFFSQNAAKAEANGSGNTEKNDADLNSRIEIDGSRVETEDKASEDKKGVADTAEAQQNEKKDTAETAAVKDDEKEDATVTPEKDKKDAVDAGDVAPKDDEIIDENNGDNTKNDLTSDAKARDKEARTKPGSGNGSLSEADIDSPYGVIKGEPRTRGITEIEIDITDEPKAPVIGIAWTDDLDTEFYTNVYKAVIEAGGQPVLLEQVESADLPYFEGRLTKGVDDTGALSDESGKLIRINSWLDSNTEYVVDGVDAVIFTGGSDISPSLYYKQEPWHGIEEERDFNAERDVSDYLLMDYCLDNNIPVMGLCRGMQMLGVVSGAEVIQDIPTYYARRNFPYRYEHRNEKVTPNSYRDFASHDVDVLDKDSVLWDITRTSVLRGVPSWHHQALKSVDGTRLKVTGSTTVSGIDLIESIERTDSYFAVGYQFHPEVVIARTLDMEGDTDAFMSYDTALRFFTELVDAAA